MPAHWWVELCLDPLVGREVSSLKVAVSLTRGGCRLRKSLGGLSADGWYCVPAPSVVQPEASQHWCL